MTNQVDPYSKKVEEVTTTLKLKEDCIALKTDIAAIRIIGDEAIAKRLEKSLNLLQGIGAER